MTNTLLWQIDGDDRPGPSYLFGTMHVRDRRAFQLLRPVMARIRETDALATEFNLEDMGREVDLQQLQLPGGLTIDALLSQKKYHKLRRIVRKAIGFDIHLLRDKLPLVIANFIDERILARDMPVALDQQLYLFAKQLGKRSLGIESYSEQLDILRSISLDQQLEALVAIGRNISLHRKHLLRMTELYEQQNIRQLYQSARRGAQGLRKLMLYDRNALMAERIDRLIREQTMVCAIGAGHLAGGKGVLRFLKHRGNRLTPLEV